MHLLSLKKETLCRNACHILMLLQLAVGPEKSKHFFPSPWLPREVFFLMVSENPDKCVKYLRDSRTKEAVRQDKEKKAPFFTLFKILGILLGNLPPFGDAG